MTYSLKIGQEYILTDEDNLLAVEVANAQHVSSGALGTRGAGANAEYRLKGVLGEIVVARMLGIEPQVHDFGGPTARPDIILPNGTMIEVKNGLPMEGKSKLRTDAWYVVVQRSYDTFKIVAIRHGKDILADAVEPPAYMCPRPGTQQLNWLIGKRIE